MMITTKGTIIQIRMNELRELSRITQGVKLMELRDGVKIAKIAKVRLGLGLDESIRDEEPSDSEE